VLGLIFQQLQRGGECATCSFEGACLWGEYEGAHSKCSGLFSAAAERGRACHLYLVSKVLVRGGNMRKRTPSARSEQMRHSDCSDIRHSDRTFLLHFWNKLGENNNVGMSIVKKKPILNKILISQNFVSEA
jgi:hypothetical protein